MDFSVKFDTVKSEWSTVYIEGLQHSGKSATIRESNHGSGVRKEHYA